MSSLYICIIMIVTAYVYHCHHNTVLVIIWFIILLLAITNVKEPGDWIGRSE